MLLYIKQWPKMHEPVTLIMHDKLQHKMVSTLSKVSVKFSLVFTLSHECKRKNIRVKTFRPSPKVKDSNPKFHLQKYNFSSIHRTQTVFFFFLVGRGWQALLWLHPCASGRQYYSRIWTGVSTITARGLLCYLGLPCAFKCEGLKIVGVQI